MNSATEAYIREHRQDGAEAIAEALAADPRFARDITKDDLRLLFGTSAVGFKLSRAANDPASQLPVELLAGMAQVVDTARYDNGFIATNSIPEVAAQVAVFAPTVVALRILTQDEVDSLLALAGGQHFEPLTPDEIKPLIEQLNADAEFDTLQVKLLDATYACRVLVSSARSSGKVPSANQIIDAFAKELA